MELRAQRWPGRLSAGFKARLELRDHLLGLLPLAAEGARLLLKHGRDRLQINKAGQLSFQVNLLPPDEVGHLSKDMPRGDSSRWSRKSVAGLSINVGAMPWPVERSHCD